MDQPKPRPYRDDTIAAITTPEGVGGVAIVRLSGNAAVGIMKAVIRDQRTPQSHRAVLGLARAADGTALDEVLSLPMLAPHSYTGEDVVEFHCHGGRMPARLVLEACLLAGARPAEAGEFTRRAFLNGRLSLDQAEAVADLIHSESGMAARAALQQLKGGLHREIDRIEMPLRDLLARLEGGLEFSDDESDDLPATETADAIRDVLGKLDRLLSLAQAGKVLREGVSVVLAGEPNSGKSSLFNALLGEERAIVDHQAGTTRDFVSERLLIEGHLFVLHDTAGLREDPGRVEAIGISRTQELMAKADLVLHLESAEAVATQPQMTLNTSAKVLRVITKSDLRPGADEAGDSDIRTSVIDGSGVPELKARLLSLSRTMHLEEAISLGVVLNQRHLHKLKSTREELDALLTLVEDGSTGDEVVATMLSTTLADLGEISGREFTETLLGDVFSRFCIGK